jgi:hypothetical protein
MWAKLFGAKQDTSSEPEDKKVKKNNNEYMQPRGCADSLADIGAKQFNCWAPLPVELWSAIFEYLPVKKLIQTAGLVCSGWHHLAIADFAWEKRVRIELGEVERPPSFPSWIAYYHSLRRSTWDQECPNMEMSLDRCVGRVVQRSVGGPHYQAIRSRQIIVVSKDLLEQCSDSTKPVLYSGTHYFEIVPLNASGVGVGIADSTIDRSGIYSRDNNGIGWYSWGSLYDRSTPGLNPSYSAGDRIGVLFELDINATSSPTDNNNNNTDTSKKPKPANSLTYYFNGVKTEYVADLTGLTRPVNVCCLLSREVMVKLQYYGSRLPHEVAEEGQRCTTLSPPDKWLAPETVLPPPP